MAPVDMLPEDTLHRNGGGAAEIIISNDGRFAYASVRTTGESVGMLSTFRAGVSITAREDKRDSEWAEGLVYSVRIILRE
jgi:6-phosphogluconolactonase (cycloisomerase 2 family)